MGNSKDKRVEELLKSLGAVAEMSLVFMRATLGAGASKEEAMKLTQAYIAALFYGQMTPPKKDE